MMRGRRLLGALLLVVLSVFATAELFAQADTIEKRQKLMKSNSAATKAIKGAVGKKDYATIETKAKELMENADMITDLFPKGSTAADSRAKAEIWDKWDEFGKIAGSLETAAKELAAAAAAKHDAQIGAKFKAVGGTCGNCHDDFRAPKKN